MHPLIPRCTFSACIYFSDKSFCVPLSTMKNAHLFWGSIAFLLLFDSLLKEIATFSGHASNVTQWDVFEISRLDQKLDIVALGRVENQQENTWCCSNILHHRKKWNTSLVLGWYCKWSLDLCWKSDLSKQCRLIVQWKTIMSRKVK